MCYEILTGLIPFEGYKTGNYNDILSGVRPVLPNHVATWIRDLIHRCWHQNPLERPTFEDIWQEFQSHKHMNPYIQPYIKHIVLEEPDNSLGDQHVLAKMLQLMK